MLQNSFFESLIDQEPDIKSEKRQTIPELLDNMENSILRDVTNLLRTQCYRLPGSPSLSELNFSLLDYGMPHYLENLFEEQGPHEEVILFIKNLINRYEPRLKFIEISPLENTNNRKHFLSLSLKGFSSFVIQDQFLEFAIEIETKPHDIFLRKL